MSKPTPSSPIARRFFEQDLVSAKAELAACLDGTWPRDLNDRLKYSPPAKADTPAKVCEYVAKLAAFDIAWLETKLNL